MLAETQVYYSTRDVMFLVIFGFLHVLVSLHV